MGNSDAVIVLGHGSRLKEANGPLFDVARMVSERMGGITAGAAFLQIASPTLEDEVSRLRGLGARTIRIVPFFLYPGAHVLHDIPDEVKRLGSLFPDIELILTEHLGVHPLMADIVADRVMKTVRAEGK